MIKVSLLLPVFNQCNRMDSILRGFLAQQIPEDWELVVIDDGSTDDTPYILKNYMDRDQVKIILNKENKGRSFVRNQLAKEARGEWLLFVDGDCSPGPFFFLLWNKFLKENSSLARQVYFGRVLYLREIASGFNRFLCMGSGADKLKQGESLPHKYLTSAHFAIEKKEFEKLQGFDESLKKWGGEDYDFAARLHLAKIEISYFKQVHVKHPDIIDLPNYFKRLEEFGKTNLVVLRKRYSQFDPFYLSVLDSKIKRKILTSKKLRFLISSLIFKMDGIPWPRFFYQYLIFNYYARGYMEGSENA